MGVLCCSNLCILLVWSSISVWVHVRGDAINPALQACGGDSVHTSCRAMVGYMASANFNLSHVASLFSLNYTSLLGPNDIDPSLPNLSDLVLPPLSKPYLLPQSCGCSTGGKYITSTNYSVVKGDTLSAIAIQFLNLVTYTEIADVSGIPNPDLIQIGQQIVIPIPCTCLNESTDSLSLSYQVQVGDSLSKIAEVYKTSTSQLQSLNLLANASELEAFKVLFVPLPVCKANFSSGALDGNLTVVEGTYELTADGCVQCNCNNRKMHCVPVPSSTFGSTCSNVTCSKSSLMLGASNTSQSSQGCSVESCVYKGYTAQSGIIARLEVEESLKCPIAPAPETFYKPPTGLVAAPDTPPPAATTAPPPAPPPPPTAPSNSNPNLSTHASSSLCFLALLLFASTYLISCT